MRKGVWIGSVPGGLSKDGLALAREAGFTGVEIPTLDDAPARQQAADLVRRYGLEVLGVMNRVHWAQPLSDPDPAVRAASVAGLRASLGTACACGAGAVLLVPAVVTPAVSYEAAWIRSAAEILPVVEEFEAAGVVLAIENVWNRFLLSPPEFARYVDQFESPLVRAYFDVGNIGLYGYAPQWIRSLGGRIARVHVKGFDTRTRAFTATLGGGDVDWPAVVEALGAIGYDGWVTCEMPQDKEDPRGGFLALGEEWDRLFGAAR